MGVGIDLAMEHDNTSKRFYALDGDNVGQKLEYYIIQDDLAGVASFSVSVSEALKAIREKLNLLDREIIFLAGDGMLFERSTFSEQELRTVQQDFQDATGCTLSVGVGGTALQALLALKEAKFTSCISVR